MAALEKFGNSILERFWSKVEKVPNGCWLWTGASISKGYGQLGGPRQLTKTGRMVPRPMYAHRVAWELYRGPLQEGQWVLHRCDVPRCVNPAHLFLGDQKANMEDAQQKGRLHVARRRRQKVTTEQLAEVDALLANGVKQCEIARRFDVTEAWVSRYVNGKSRQYDRPVTAAEQVA